MLWCLANTGKQIADVNDTHVHIFININFRY